MIHVVFSDSAAGSLRFAMSMGKGKYVGGASSVIIRHDDGSPAAEDEISKARAELEARERLRWENAVPLAGSPKDVFSFHLALSQFHIAGDMWQNRREALAKLFSVFPDIGLKAADELLLDAQNSLKNLLSRLKTGEELCVWYSDQPDEACGLYWLMTQLDRDHAGSVSAIKLPAYEDLGNCVLFRAGGWGEVAPEEFSRYLPLKTPVTPLLRRTYAQKWHDLKAENAPLRACVNGNLISVGEDFYDGVIRAFIAKQPDRFHEARLIGEILGKCPLGLGDAFIALRIESMIARGELNALSGAPQDEPIYRRELTRTALWK